LWKVDGKKLSADYSTVLSEIFPKNSAEFVFIHVQLFVNDEEKKISDFDAPISQYLPPNALQARSIVVIIDDEEPTSIDPKDLNDELSLQTFMEMSESLKVIKIKIDFPPRGGLFVRMQFKNNERVEVGKDDLLSTLFSEKVYLQIEGKDDPPCEVVDLDDCTFWVMLCSFYSMEDDKLQEYLDTNEITFIATK